MRNVHYQVFMMNFAQNLHLCQKFFCFGCGHLFNWNFLHKSQVDQWGHRKYIGTNNGILEINRHRPDHGGLHGIQSHMYHGQEDLNQRTHQLMPIYHHKRKQQASPHRRYQLPKLRKQTSRKIMERTMPQSLINY